MADKGFIVKDLFPLGVSLNLPPFLGASSQIAVEDVVKTQEIASLWIHVEPAFNKKFSHLGQSCSTTSNRDCKPDVGSVCILL